MFSKNKVAMLVGEFLGTAALTLTVLSVSRQLGLAYFVAFAAGLIMVLMTLALAGISGAVFNPAMTIGLWTVRKLRTLQMILYIIFQLLGGAAAYWLFTYFLKQHLPNSDHYSGRVLVAEAIGSFVFAFGWAAAVYQRFNLAAKAATIGGSLAAGALIASLGSAAFLNPAIALGARNWSWFTYVLGPIIGAVVGFNLYNLLFVQTEVAEAQVARATTAPAKPARATATTRSTRSRTAKTTKPAARKTATRRRK